MHNKDQSNYDQDELHRDALKALIRDELKEGAGHAGNIAKRLGETPGKRFVEILHEMEEDEEIKFSNARGYKL